jgi:hypothetical protein
MDLQRLVRVEKGIQKNPMIGFHVDEKPTLAELAKPCCMQGRGVGWSRIWDGSRVRDAVFQDQQGLLGRGGTEGCMAERKRAGHLTGGNLAFAPCEKTKTGYSACILGLRDRLGGRRGTQSWLITNKEF